jgi:glycosyltransferase involved in cell wall biosynthesis
MRIGLRLFYNPSWMGGINYVMNIARMLKMLPDGEQPEIVFLTTTAASEDIARQNSDLADLIAPFTTARTLGLDFVYPATQIPEAPFGAPWAGWIPDWQCQHFPELFSAAERARRYLQYRELALQPVSCVFSSQQALDDTRALFAEGRVAQWDVFHFPAVFDAADWTRAESAVAETRVRLGIPERYLIVCNQFWKHKNHLAILEALRLSPSLNVHVVMTGAMEDGRWPDYAEAVRLHLEDPQVARRVSVTGRIDRSDQINLLLGAYGYIQPSLFEGWSTFVEEARALGLPGLLSDIPVHREQSPQGAVFFDAHRPDDLAAKLFAFVAAPPPVTPRAEAKAEQDRYILDAARAFMSIARRANASYVPANHELTQILGRRLPEMLSSAGEAGRYTADDISHWLTTLRALLRDHPEDLARLAAAIPAMNAAVSSRFEQEIVQATLAKLHPDMQARFSAEAERVEAEDANDAIAKAQNFLQAPEQRVRAILRRATMAARKTLHGHRP